MDVRELLEQMKPGGVNVEEAEKQFKNPPYEDLGYTKLDHRRKLRSGFRETVFYQGKPDVYLLGIYRKFYERDEEVLGTRTSKKQAELVRVAVPEMVYGPISRILEVEKPGKERKGYVAVYTGNAADILVAEEIVQTTEYSGYKVDRIFDVGVAEIHKLLARRERLDKAGYTVAVAGVEGALGTVITGPVECPVVAVPTSVGYRASFHRLSALPTMLNFCANGISVINIDNGYGASYLAT